MQEQFRLGDMIHKLLQVEDDTWGRYAFSRDPLNRRIPPDKKAEMIAAAIQCGREYAHRVILTCGCSDIRTVAEKLKLKIEFKDTAMTGNRVLFARYTSPDRIEIMEEPVRRAVSLISEEDSIPVELFCGHGIMSVDIIPAPNEESAHQRHEEAHTVGACGHGIMSVDIIPAPNEESAHQRHEEAHTVGACGHGIMDTILGHEIYHFIEEQYEHEIYTRTEKIRLWNFMGFKNDSAIRALSEIGAMAFTKELNGLKYSPFILDILLYYGYDSSGAGKIYRDILGMSSGRCRETVEDY